MVLNSAIIIAIWALALVSSTASAHSVGYAHYYGSCADGIVDNGYGGYNAQAGVSRPLSGDSEIYQMVESTVEIENLYPCSYSSGYQVGFDMVNAANIIGNGTWAQCGYAQLDCGLLGYCSDFNSRVTDFWWTPCDHTTTNCNGINYKAGQVMAATWVDFNGGGHDKPESGEVYRFNINRASVGGVWKWQFCVYSVSGRFGSSASSCTYIDASYLYGTQVWWSFENYNDASSFGPNEPDDNVTIDDMHYQYYGSSTLYTVTTGGGNPCENSTKINGVPATRHSNDYCGLGTRSNGHLFVSGYEKLHN